MKKMYHEYWLKVLFRNNALFIYSVVIVLAKMKFCTVNRKYMKGFFKQRLLFAVHFPLYHNYFVCLKMLLYYNMGLLWLY